MFDRGPGSLLAHLDDGAASLGERLPAPGPGGVAAFAGGRHAALVDAVRRHAAASRRSARSTPSAWRRSS
ncbi:MAG: hypothetical protein R2736_13430 [Solirubrobacterales bacterium]